MANFNSSEVSGMQMLHIIMSDTVNVQLFLGLLYRRANEFSIKFKISEKVIRDYSLDLFVSGFITI